MYRYASINLTELLNHLKIEQVATMASDFAKAFSLVYPKGMEHSYAPHTCPALCLFTIQNRPLNYCNAFEDPIDNCGHGYTKGSIEALQNYAEETLEFLDAPKVAFITGGKDFEIQAETIYKGKLTDMCNKIKNTIIEELSISEN